MGLKPEKALLIAVLFCVLFSSTFDSNAAITPIVSNNDYTHLMYGNSEDIAQVLFVLPEKGEFHVRDALNLRMIFKCEFDGWDKRRKNPTLFNDKILLPQYAEDKYKTKYSIYYFDGRVEQFEFYDVIQIIWEDEPMFLEYKDMYAGNRDEHFIRAVKGGEVLWRRDLTDRQSVGTNHVSSKYFWIYDYAKKTRNASLRYVQTGDQHSVADGYCTLMNDEISILALEHDDKSITFEFLDNDKVSIFHTFEYVYDWPRPLFRLCEDKVYMISDWLIDEYEPTFDANFLIAAITGEIVHDGILTLPRGSSFHYSMEDRLIGYYNGLLLIDTNSMRGIETIDWKTNRSVWSHNPIIRNEFEAFAVGGYHYWIQGDYLLYSSLSSYSGCIKLDGYKNLWRLKNGYEYDYIEYDGLEYFIYHYPTDNQYFSEINIRVRDLTTGEFEPYDYTINDVFVGNKTTDFIPTKHGILLFYKLDPQVGGISLFKPGYEEPFYEVKGFHYYSMSWERIENDDDHLMLLLYRYPSSYRREEVSKVMFDIESGELLYGRGE